MELAKYKDELLEAKKNFDGSSLELSSMKEKFESLKKKSDEDWKRMKEEFASKESQKDADYQSDLNKVRSEVVSKYESRLKEVESNHEKTLEEARSSQSSVVKDLVSKEIQKGAEKLKSMKSIFEKKIKGIEVANKKLMK